MLWSMVRSLSRSVWTRSEKRAADFASGKTLVLWEAQPPDERAFVDCLISKSDGEGGREA